MKALPGYVIVTPIKETEDKTTSGLYILYSKDRPIRGIVVDVGEQTATEGPRVAVGETIYHRQWAGDEIKVGEKEYRIIKFSDCMAKE